MDGALQNLYKAIPHKERLATLHAICVQSLCGIAYKRKLWRTKETLNKKRMPRTGNQSVRGMFFLSGAYVSLGHLTHMLCAVLP